MDEIKEPTTACPCQADVRHTHRSAEEKHALLNRMHRISGQMRAIETMLEEDRYCNDILIQTAAVGAALASLEKELLSAHIRNCVARDIRDGRDEVIEELTTTVRKLIR